MEKGEKSVAEHNLLVAVIGITFAAGLCAATSAWVCSYTLDAFSNSQSAALLITDGGRFVSDDATLGRQLTEATVALQDVRDLAIALALGCVSVAAGVLYRLTRSKGF